MTATTSTSIVAPRLIEPGIDAGVPPDEEDAGDARDEGGEAERERPVQLDVVAERSHARRLVPDSLERDAERCRARCSGSSR